MFMLMARGLIAEGDEHQARAGDTGVNDCCGVVVVVVSQLDDGYH